MCPWTACDHTSGQPGQQWAWQGKTNYQTKITTIHLKKQSGFTSVKQIKRHRPFHLKVLLGKGRCFLHHWHPLLQ